MPVSAHPNTIGRQNEQHDINADPDGHTRWIARHAYGYTMRRRNPPPARRITYTRCIPTIATARLGISHGADFLETVLGRPASGRSAARPHARIPSAWPDTGLHAAWLGHTTVLLKIDGVTILTDPVFSTRVGLNFGPVTLGIKRLVAPALRAIELPKIDIMVLSHAHFDHFDIPSLAPSGKPPHDRRDRRADGRPAARQPLRRRARARMG